MDRLLWRGCPDGRQGQASVTPHKLHRALAATLLVFVALHLINNLALFLGPHQHQRVQEALRPIYRNPVIEPLLIAGFGVQLFTGFHMIRRQGWPRTLLRRVQVLSGAIVGLFLVQHISATLLTRMLKPEIDTNIYWAAAVVNRLEFAVYFAPYYALGVAALFAHVAAYVAIRRRQRAIAFVIVAAGAAFAIALVVAMTDISLPVSYETYLDEFWF